jgi:hypothetical protein
MYRGVVARSTSLAATVQTATIGDLPGSAAVIMVLCHDFDGRSKHDQTLGRRLDEGQPVEDGLSVDVVLYDSAQADVGTRSTLFEWP